MVCCHDHGVNFFDNAEVYANGRAEKIMGLAIRELDWRRSDIVVSTKIFWGGPGPNDKGFSRKHIIEGTKASLKRLDMDYIYSRLQQFRQKKADKNTDHKKDPKGSTSQGNPPKNLHEPKPDTGGVSDEAEAPSDVAVGGASSHVNIGEEVVDPPPTSVNAAANSDVSVDTLQPGNTTATSDSGDEPRKEVANSENDISVALSTEEENVKSIDIGAAGAVDSLTSDLADTEKGVTHDDAEESLLAVRSELQKRSNELEQSEQRLLSTREKLSIAVVTC
ncbi:LOW QUALITY PROTEIN: hypothetical protein HID58_020068 [Brassica napus]|uniref:NADP-dependent oxidoreductase domain-containing protein n=1 Tax=Brassica napus TaxID=3708 RepID=A0ABQ8DEM6_BRANA|nr:LOW QUALITY PROTEIN: hypothetical protein HID58_020068 [Brassica napus]